MVFKSIQAFFQISLLNLYSSCDKIIFYMFLFLKQNLYKTYIISHWSFRRVEHFMVRPTTLHVEKPVTKKIFEISLKYQKGSIVFPPLMKISIKNRL